MAGRADVACDKGRFDEAEHEVDVLLGYRPAYRDDPGVELVRIRIALGRRAAAVALARVDSLLPRIPADDLTLRAAAQLVRAEALLALDRRGDAQLQLVEVDPRNRDLARRRVALAHQLKGEGTSRKPPGARLLKGGASMTTALVVDDRKRAISLRAWRRRRVAIALFPLFAVIMGFVNGFAGLAVSLPIFVVASLLFSRYARTANDVVRRAHRLCDRRRFERAEKLLDEFEAMAPEYAGNVFIADIRARIARRD